MGILLLLLVFLIYGLFIFSIYKRENTVFIITYLFLTYSYDYLFIELGYFFPDIVVNVLKPVNEYLLLFLVLLLVYKVSITRKFTMYKVDRLFLLVLIPTIFSFCLNDLATLSTDAVLSVQGVRLFITPIVIPYLFLRLNYFKTIKDEYLFYFLIVMGILTIVFGLYQKNTFNGDLSSIWFYKSFDKGGDNPIDKGSFNFIKNDDLRVTSLFVSSIIYSLTIAFNILMLISFIVAKGLKQRRWLLILLLLIHIYGLEIAGTRIGFFVVILGIILMLVLNFKRKTPFVMLAFVPIATIFLTIFFLISGYTDDLSALGRLVQYTTFGAYFSIIGLGFSSKFVQTLFDSYYISIALLFGVGSVCIAIYYWKLNELLYRIIKEVKSPFLFAACAISLSLLYAFAFQFTAGSCPYKLAFLFIFYSLSKTIYLPF